MGRTLGLGATAGWRCGGRGEIGLCVPRMCRYRRGCACRYRRGCACRYRRGCAFRYRRGCACEGRHSAALTGRNGEAHPPAGGWCDRSRPRSAMVGWSCTSNSCTGAALPCDAVTASGDPEGEEYRTADASGSAGGVTRLAYRIKSASSATTCLRSMCSSPSSNLTVRRQSWSARTNSRLRRATCSCLTRQPGHPTAPRAVSRQGSLAVIGARPLPPAPRGNVLQALQADGSVCDAVENVTGAGDTRGGADPAR
eukprot:scaffold1883_cov108-Isochrysis_galbana.AAC.6